MSVLRRLRQGVVGTAYSAYYTARDLNYAHGWSTPKSAGEVRFRTYEPYGLHGNDAMLRELLTRTEPGDVVYDIGANVGIYTCAVASAGADVVALEPNPHARGKLRQNLRANAFEATVLPFAASDEDATATLHVSSYPETTSLNRANATVSGGSVVESIEVRTRRLDSLCDGLPEPDHVKIDVEGEGVGVLRGSERLLRRKEPTVYFETHPDDGGSTEERRILDDVGYTVEEVGDGWLCTP
ncbi:FkbM family methyltransferase [Haladaptatus sp. F3-133]|jgi:FkbM family methyltransferase|uniref:FkbM family methyltransferase n=1 Tax=Halorutilus salinus TaxID=2487751 RepID=A0A9Q4C529_9EURY|nr:FkbM family methyltransferase [Halorutilus salinus]MCX2819418.1 FkbM family methyltransferase [Halorutilus salinus]